MKKSKLIYSSIKVKLKTISKDNALSKILYKKVTKVSKIFVCASYLLNHYVLYCLNNNLSINLDETLIRQCANMVIDKNTKLGRIKKAYEANPINKDKIDARKKRLKILEKVFKKFYEICDHEQFTKEKCILRPADSFSSTFLANVKNHISMNFYKFLVNC